MSLGVSELVDAALDYAKRGWHVVPLHNLRADGSCTCSNKTCDERNRGKHPRLSAWQNNSSIDADQIEGWWAQWPSANIGVQLGEKSGLIDVECDSEEAEVALADLFDNDFPVVPTYSASRGKHRLFLWSPGLPEPDKAVFKWNGVEFRTGGGKKGAQSVFPPSIHPTRKQYQWLVHPDDAELMQLPLHVIQRLLVSAPSSSPAANGTPSNGRSTKGIKENLEAAGEVESPRWMLYKQKEVLEGVDGRDNVIHAEACAMWREQVILQGVTCLDDGTTQAVVYERLWGLNLSKCKPPLDTGTVQKKIESARKFIKEQNVGPRNTGLTALGLEYSDGEWWPGQWRLETINSDPPIARLYTPFLARGFIEMTMSEFDEPKHVHRAVLGATGCICLDDRPGMWRSIWDGKPATNKNKATRGVKAKLIEASVMVEAPLEVRREAVIAGKILAYLVNSKNIEEGNYPGTHGASKMPDGTIAFIFDPMWEPMNFGSDKVSRNELSRVLRDIGSKDRWLFVGKGDRKKFKVLNKEAIKALEKMYGKGADECS